MVNDVINIRSELERITYPGRTDEAVRRNRALLDGYDYDAYVEGITGYAGQDLQKVEFIKRSDAVRTRVGERGNYKAGMALMPDGTLVAAACRVNRDSAEVVFNIHVYCSRDNGDTWEKRNRTTLFGKEPALACLPDGTLLLTSQAAGIYDAGAVRLPVYRSADDGVTWEVNYIEGNRDYPRNILVNPDGSALIVRAKDFRYWFEENRSGSPDFEIAHSVDGGVTWELGTGKVDWDFTGFAEMSAIKLKNGRMIASLRRQPMDTKGEGYEDTVFTESLDGGATWEKPWRISNTGEVHWYLTELADGRVLGTFSNYHLPYGVYAVISKDGGRTWDQDNYIQLAVSNDIYVGWPVTLQLPDGSLVTSYAATTYLCQKPDTTTCEVVRWKLSV